MAAEKPQLDLFRSYDSTIENSVGSALFKSAYFRVDGVTTDILKDGLRSCAVYVSSMLYLFKLIDDRHATVESTIRDMQASGWHKIEQPKKGAVIWWDLEREEDVVGENHPHIGFYIDSETAVSNSMNKRVIAKHHPTYGTLENGEPRRKVLGYYWHDKLDS